MTAAFVPLRTVLGIDRGDLKYVFIDMLFMKRMQMAVVEIVDMVVMFDCSVAAANAVLVGMILVDCMCAHGLFSFLSKLMVELK
jgi:hypothetical protein